MSLSVNSRNLGFGVLLSAGIVLSLVPMGSAQATPSTVTVAAVEPGNYQVSGNGRGGQYILEDRTSGESSSAASVQGDLTTPRGNTIEYSATAQASLSGGLKAKSSISGDGFAWNASDPLYVLADGTTNPNGVPHWYTSIAYAQMADMLTVTGAEDLSSISFLLQVDGKLHNGTGLQGYDASVSLGRWGHSIFQSNVLSTPAGHLEFDEMMTTGLYSVVDGQVDFDLFLMTTAEYGIKSWPLAQGSGPLPAGGAYADFFSTVTIAEIFGFNEFGQRVSLFSVTGSDGTILPTVRAPPVSAVPEPATWAMMIAGFGIVGGTLRRRNRAMAFA